MMIMMNWPVFDLVAFLVIYEFTKFILDLAWKKIGELKNEN